MVTFSFVVGLFVGQAVSPVEYQDVYGIQPQTIVVYLKNDFFDEEPNSEQVKLSLSKLGWSELSIKPTGVLKIENRSGKLPTFDDPDHEWGVKEAYLNGIAIYVFPKKQ